MAPDSNAQVVGKHDQTVSTNISSQQTSSPSHLAEPLEMGYGEATHDVSDMKRLGKKQEFRVRLVRTTYSPTKLTRIDNRGTLASCPLWASFLSTWRPGSLYWCMLPFQFFQILRRLMSVLRSLSVGLLNGGFGGLFWVFVGTVLCYSTIVASLAEMESM